MNQLPKLTKWFVGAVAALSIMAIVSLLAIVSLRAQWLGQEEIDVITKVVAGLGLVAGGIWAVVSYSHAKKQEFQKNFNDRQVEIILLTANTVGDLVGSKDSDEWSKAKARFWELYWGRLVLFEDDAIIAAMVTLGNKLRDTQYERREGLIGEAYAVSLTLRDFLTEKNANEWRISFADLKNASKGPLLKKKG